MVRPVLDINHIAKTFNPGLITEKKALIDVDLHLEAGDFVTVIGGNGAGKSTTLNAVAGVFPVDSGSIIIDGKDVTSLPEYKRAQYLGRVFQDPMTGTAPTMNIDENMALALRRGKHRGLKWGISNFEREMFREQLSRLGLGLEDRLSSKVGLLSGGQRQRVLLARALCATRKVLLLDEPITGLDPLATAEFYEIIEELRREGITVIMISHDVSCAVHYGNKILHLGNEGYFFGTSEEYVHSPLGQQMLAGGHCHD